MAAARSQLRERGAVSSVSEVQQGSRLSDEWSPRSWLNFDLRGHSRNLCEPFLDNTGVRPVCVPDRRGRGSRGPAPGDRFDLTAESEDLELLVDASSDFVFGLSSGAVGRWRIRGRSGDQRAIQPPSTASTWPCTYAAAEEARNTTTLPMSCGCPQRPAGIRVESCSMRTGSDSSAVFMSVTM